MKVVARHRPIIRVAFRVKAKGAGQEEYRFWDFEVPEGIDALLPGGQAEALQSFESSVAKAFQDAFGIHIPPAVRRRSSIGTARNPDSSGVSSTISFERPGPEA